ncbi:hydroxyacid dehydrogenase [Pigmentiphaga litoralis]|uniref:D-3-phosphoglycerate dehydrogenase n=1 Tax=Pigmentiphaga litoralis TaxID=516702 RepID=A0A7Y9IQX8_9BURK|nr:hydroxyacid dehydrogenase [Pigmentiphaga litoralis]NYE25032.1 D-3-phosphoglycerate dehydrogenase [Pigmentiphaga litoralis]NYE81354.1 D-3-phosphoglycerate dehydrogenase [Pigmentiphaga litoralis]
MPVCLIVQPIHPSGVERLTAAGVECRMASSPDMATVAREIADCDAVITRNAGLDTAAITAARRLQVIANHGIGTNKIDVAHATDLAIPIIFTPSANARSVAEHAIMMALAVGKRLLPSDHAVRTGDWDYRYQPGLQELFGKTLGIVGFGTIGRLTADIASKGFGMRVVVHSPSAEDAMLAAHDAERCGTLDDLLAQSDVVSLHQPSRLDTRHLINARTLALMRPTAILVNTARADLIDTAALVAALESGQIAGAGLDVFDQEPLAADSPLQHLSRVVMTPHTAGGTDEALKAAADQCADQILQVLAGQRPAHLVRPAIWDRRRTQTGA